MAEGRTATTTIPPWPQADPQQNRSLDEMPFRPTAPEAETTLLSLYVYVAHCPASRFGKTMLQWELRSDWRESCYDDYLWSCFAARV